MPYRKLFVSSSLQRAQLYKGENLEKEFTVSTAANGLGCKNDSYCTPSGTLKVARKIGDGLPIGSVFRARVPEDQI